MKVSDDLNRLVVEVKLNPKKSLDDLLEAFRNYDCTNCGTRTTLVESEKNDLENGLYNGEIFCSGNCVNSIALSINPKYNFRASLCLNTDEDEDEEDLEGEDWEDGDEDDEEDPLYFESESIRALIRAMLRHPNFIAPDDQVEDLICAENAVDVATEILNRIADERDSLTQIS
jgi:hypothetical protein